MTFITPPAARAAPHTVCLYFDLDSVYQDASPTTDTCFGGPCLPTCCDGKETRWPAQRHLARIRDDGGVLWGWRPLDGLGCTDAFDTEASTLLVDYLPWAYFDARDTSVVGFDCDSLQQPDRCSFGPSTVTSTPNPSGPTRVRIIDPDGSEPLLAVNSLTWVASFAEERIPLWSGVVSYLVASESGPVSSHYWIGGQPSSHLRHSAFQRKVSIAHEFGHLQTQFHAIAKLGEVFEDGSVDLSFMGGGMHFPTSPEWQSAAAAEGFGNYYMLLVWWDHTTPVAGWLAQTMGSDTLTLVGDTTLKRVIDDACVPFDLTECPPGVATEMDWMAALWNLSLSGVPPDRVLKLVSRAYVWPPDDDLWPVNGESDAFWVNFTSAAEDFLTPQEYESFITIAEQAGIDR